MSFLMLGIHFLTEAAEVRVDCGQKGMDKSVLCILLIVVDSSKAITIFPSLYQLGSLLLHVSDASLCTKTLTCDIIGSTNRSTTGSFMG